VPFNIFGGAGSITPAMLDFVDLRPARQQQEFRRGTSPPTFRAICSSCRAGRARPRRRLEYRKLKGQFDPDPSSPRASARTFRRSRPRALQRQGSLCRNQRAAAPGRPFADLLELSGAVRFSDYSTSGSTTTFKAGVNWKPIQDLRLRAPGPRASAPRRSASCSERLALRSALSDPCSNDSTATAELPQRRDGRANCIAQGVPAGGTYQQANPQISVIVGGNEALKPKVEELGASAASTARRSCRGFSSS
jgi:iron complex outermembrane receptor protein